MLKWFRRVDWLAVTGLIRIDDDLVERVRRRVHARVSTMPIVGKTREKAELEIEQAARWEVVSVFREAHPGRDYQLKPSWPHAECMLADDGEIMVRVWIGHDYSDAGNGIAPIRTTVKWSVEQHPLPVSTQPVTPKAPATNRLKQLEENRKRR
jgi:hypothetical protein